MKKRILNEVNRTREIMGLGVILEQDANPDDYKKYDGGEPYKLFLLKATPTSKLYMGSTGGETTGAKIFKYRKRNPWIVSVEGIKIKIEGLDKTSKNYEKQLERLNKIIKNYQEKYKQTLSKKQFDKEHRYTSSEDSVKKAKRTDNPYEVNPEFVEGSRGVKVDIPLTPNEKFALMEKIRTFVKKYYGGDYSAAAETKKISKKTKTTRYYGILSIKLKPGKIEIIKDEVEQPEPLPGFEEAIELTDGGGMSVFPNNEWEVGDQIKDWATDTIAVVNKMKSEFTEKGYKDITVEMTDTKFDDSGKVVKIPYTIATSASRIPNGGKAKDLTLLELSEKRAESTKNYLQQVFSSAGIKMIEPIVSFQADGKVNKDGSTGGASGPEWTGKDADRPNYEKHKYCKIAVAFKLSSPGLTEEVLQEPETETKVGEWNMNIKRYTKGRPWKKLITTILDWELPKPKPTNGRRPRKFNTIACPSFD
jgi:hypothetical protein|tara:strand:+ start:1078 stop:2508 length:1431 start_codon:yes stop_codon:yes gene_type:complete